MKRPSIELSCVPTTETTYSPIARTLLGLLYNVTIYAFVFST